MATAARSSGPIAAYIAQAHKTGARASLLSLGSVTVDVSLVTSNMDVAPMDNLLHIGEGPDPVDTYKVCNTEWPWSFIRYILSTGLKALALL